MTDNIKKLNLLENIKENTLILAEYYTNNLQITLNVNTDFKKVKIDIKECNI